MSKQITEFLRLQLCDLYKLLIYGSKLKYLN